jgi:LysM repeat protein
MRLRRYPLTHLLAPAALLLGVTIVVLLARPAYDNGGTTQTSSLLTQTAATTTTTTHKKATVSPRIYRVQSGDTLGAIASRFNTTVAELMALNPGIEPTALRVGQQIRIGGRATSG